jgi:hypothetical protein
MDIFQTTFTAIHEIYAVAVFIKGIVDDVRAYDNDRADIRARLSHEFLFFDNFKDMFFDGGPGQEFYSRRSLAFRTNCDKILVRMQIVLAEYKVKATKYGLVDLDEDDNQDDAAAAKGRWLSKFKDGMVAQMSELKKKAIKWSIFDKPRILAMLVELRD